MLIFLTKISIPFLMIIFVDGHAEQHSDEFSDGFTEQINLLEKSAAGSTSRMNEPEKMHGKELIAAPSSPLQTLHIADNHAEPSKKVSEIKKSNLTEPPGNSKWPFKIPGTDTSVGLGGFVKLDTLFSSIDMGEDTDGSQRLEVHEIPDGVSRTGHGGEVTFHAKQTRVWLKSLTPTHWLDIRTHLEMDFFGSPKLYNYTPRLRHAYATIGQLLVGQTWTTFFNLPFLGQTLDFGRTVGVPFPFRQPQVRWTQPFSIGDMPVEWLFAAETPQNYIWVADQAKILKLSNGNYPDLITKLKLRPTWGSLSLALMARQINYTPAADNDEKSMWGAAVSLGGQINTVGADNIRFFLNYGNPLGRYGTNTFFADAAVDSTGNMHLITAYSGMLAYQHWWSDAWHSNVVYGIARANQPGFAATANQQTQSFHANLLWTPVKETMIGVEYIYGNRELANGQNGELHRVQFSTQFSF